MKNRTKGVSVYIIVLLLLMALATVLFTNQPTTSTLKYSQLLSYFDEGKIDNFKIDFGTGDMEFTLKGEEQATAYKLPNILIFREDVDVREYARAHKIEYDYIQPKETPWWITMLPSLFLTGIMVVFWIMMMRQTGAGGSKAMSFGKAKVKPLQDGRKVTFDDVAGADEEKEELVEIVEFLKAPGKFNALGARIPKGVLLKGPPGTGKTLLARAVAGEAGVPFFSISGSDFVEMFVGVGASRVRDLFEQAKKNAPSIIFIDEIDAVGRHRGAGLGGGHDEREQTLNQLLVEMDGFGANTGVIIIAATNRSDILDPALLRPGRFDRQVVVSYPDVKGRQEILKVHTRGKPIGPDVDLEVIAKKTIGFTGADLENLVNEAALLAARKEQKAIVMNNIDEATIKVIAGPEKKSHVVSDKDKLITAYHEVGHALCTYFGSTRDKVNEISIIRRGMAAGYTLSLPTEDRTHQTKKQMEEQLLILLSGRVAEKIVFDDISTGASNDLERATAIARDMVTRYGFSEKVGSVVYGQGSHEVFLGRDLNQGRNYSETIATTIDTEVRRIIEEAYQHAMEILTTHRDKLDEVSKVLFEKEKIDGAEFYRIMEGTNTAEGEEPAADVDTTPVSEQPAEVSEPDAQTEAAPTLDPEEEEDGSDENKRHSGR